MRVDLLLAHADLIEASRPSVAYCRKNGIDFAATVPACGGVYLAEIYADGRTFLPCAGGALAAWCEAIAEDAEAVLDVVAWPVDRPERWWTLGGLAPALGMSFAANPASYAFGSPLRLHRTPLRWLQAKCDGAVVLDRQLGARWLLDVPAPRIATEDRAHARESVAAMDALVGRQRFVVPANDMEAAA